jgi:homocysteine S-methyltransferase
VIVELCKETVLPVSALPNAGLPRRSATGRFEYRIDGAYLARYASKYVEAGARLVGGCCGTTPDHIQAIVAEVGGLPARIRSAAPPAPKDLSPPSLRFMPALPTGLAQLLGDRQFAAVYELPTSAMVDAEGAASAVETVRHHGIDVFMVPSADLSRIGLTSTSLALHLKGKTGCEAMASVATWDKTIMALQADLLGAHALGLRIVVCETGTPPLRESYPNADGIWEVDSVGLVSLLSSLNDGRDCAGLPLATSTWFHIGARCNPEADDLDAEIDHVRSNLRAGAHFLVSRPVHDVDRMMALVDAVSDLQPPILATIAPFRSFDDADFVVHEVPDTRVPQRILDRLEHAGGAALRVGLEIAVETAALVRPRVQGIVIKADDSDTIRSLVGAMGDRSAKA